MPKIKCIIIHGSPLIEEKELDPKDRTCDKHWMPWTKRQLAAKGIETTIPIMPSPWDPVYESYKKEMDKLKIDEHTILIGHSSGAAFLVRWLGDTKKFINKLILVAPWKIPRPGDKSRERFYVYPIDKTIKDRVKEIIMFTSDNEDENGKKSLKMFHDAIGGKIIDLKGRGHYIISHMGTEEFPELIEAITR